MNMTADLPLFDICSRRHGGNAESTVANRKAAPSKAAQRQRVLEACKGEGITCRELAERWGVGMNQISGRFTELKRTGTIFKVGTRAGCGVFRAR